MNTITKEHSDIKLINSVVIDKRPKMKVGTLLVQKEGTKALKKLNNKPDFQLNELTNSFIGDIDEYTGLTFGEDSETYKQKYSKFLYTFYKTINESRNLEEDKLGLQTTLLLLLDAMLPEGLSSKVKLRLILEDY